MNRTTLRAGLLSLAALLAACGESQPPSLGEAPGNPPTDPDQPLPPKMRCAPGVADAATTLAQAGDCASTTGSPS
ncbi:hypothetical protein ED208_14650 [Stagnimonas aquatica]|uniref:Lipoprotein n=1 Tax=Stagnimonas aquatica TaxID=2689987 RepID=A0A3N0V2C3_9GAMM|nr:hypothetical protein [Stagnimonas aquatica]ROH86681.1 hypothetical protein ED208_14650 [Stagnimonas aquatica]